MTDINIMIFGDSITYGASDNIMGGWVNRLRIDLENRTDDIDYNVFNMGISGQISSEILERFKFECDARIIKGYRTIIIFAIGINDTQNINGNDRVSIEKFKTNILELIKQAKMYSSEVYFVGLTKVDEKMVIPLPWDNEKSYFNKKIIIFDNELEKICNNENIGYIKTFNLLSLSDLSDGLHPNEIGHHKMFLKIKDSIFND